MKRLMLAGLMVLGLAASAMAETRLTMNVGGAAVPRVVDGANEWVYQWPGIYFEGRFHGDSVALHMDDANNWFDVQVDGRTLMVLKRPGKTVVRLEHLGAGEHVVRLEKRTETQAATGAFGGFFVERKEDALMPKARARKMIFLGDSLTVGYGNTSAFTKCSKDEVFETTDTSEAFGPLVAKHFDAEYEVRAFSGLGLVRNYGGKEYPQFHLGSLWQRAIFEDASSHAGEWDPHVLVIGIGGNDFSTQVTATEKWKTQAEMASEYSDTYVEFLKELRYLYPHALIVMTWTSDKDALYTQTAQFVFAKAQADGVGNMDHLEFPKMDRTGCNGHPNLRDDAKVAELLEAVIARHPGAWQGK
ncbi:MAG: SGNH/GDSL hydrolase family protein [Acidobacteriota bacterium]